ncbi:hypothetical protein CN918_32685 [Priestia megaterium]|nr:hypothetical protein CN918_32685 [Priestia megaterium]
MRTRNPNKPEILIENLEVLECTVCPHTELTESSELLVSMMRQKIREEIVRDAQLAVEEQQQQVVDKTNAELTGFSRLKEKIRKWIG